MGTAAAGAAGYTVSQVAGPSVAEAATRKEVDVVVVGAGLAGLAAARRLKRRGASVAVLEARDRVGGRTLNHQLGHGKVVEIGGQWVGPTQYRVLKLIKDLGLRTFKTYVDGKNVYYRQSNPPPLRLQEYTGTIPPANPASLVELAKALNSLDKMAAQVPLSEPWKASSAKEWDGQTFETWKLANTTLDETRDLIDLGIEAVFAAEPRDLSLLHVLFYIHSGGSFENLINTPGGAQDSRIVGRLAEDLDRGRQAARRPSGPEGARRADRPQGWRREAPHAQGDLGGESRDRDGPADARGTHHLQSRICPLRAISSPSGSRWAR